MDNIIKNKLEYTFPKCHSILDSDIWEQITADASMDPETFIKELKCQVGKQGIPEFIPELARLEHSLNELKISKIKKIHEVNKHVVNPTLQLLKLSWKNLTEFLYSEEDLLVLKMVVEDIDPKEVAATGGLPIGAVDSALYSAVKKGLLLAPKSLIHRNFVNFPEGNLKFDTFLSTSSFTLQWHITQECDLHCKHCYDRNDRSSLNLEQAIGVLDDLRSFCLNKHVKGQVTFTGGNPLLYPYIYDLYRAASEYDFSISILGNPAPYKQIEKLLKIRQPYFFQVSIEGLPEHNDRIRGKGHFDRTIEFLKMLRDLNVSSMVMLTLTKDNIDQVLPLAEMLRDLTDDFHFNRLTLVGEGANLSPPSKQELIKFLKAYIKAAESNPIMGIKDNLINILRDENCDQPFGGCTGFGCGAAFNFISVLSDGEAHACRKFPSPIGNIISQGISDVYDSEIASRYRKGCKACQSCNIRPVCGGCLAIAHSFGLNEFEEKDPYCFHRN